MADLLPGISLGRLTVITDALGSTTNTYDNLRRWIAVSNAFGQAQAAVYDVADRVVRGLDTDRDYRQR